MEHRVTALFVFVFFLWCLLLVWLFVSLEGRGIYSVPLRHIKVTQDNNFVPAGAGRFLSVFCAGLTYFERLLCSPTLICLSSLGPLVSPLARSSLSGAACN